MKVLASNKRGRFDYDITEKLVSGLELTGAEVKSIKAGHISLKGSFVAFRGGEAFLTNAHVTDYAYATKESQPNPTRSRKLLMKRKEIDRLTGDKQAGLSVIPLAVLLGRNLVKVELGIGRGKKRFDKRASIKEREVTRDIARRFAR